MDHLTVEVGDSLDLYQDFASQTAIYPRVYTEEQVRNMLLRAYIRGSGVDQRGSLVEDAKVEDAKLWVEYDLDKAETPFNRLVYPVLGLVGEAGEIANKLKKVARDNGGVMSAEQTDDIAAENGDVLWYVSAITKETRRSLSSIAQANITKLFSRKQRGVLAGSGDNR